MSDKAWLMMISSTCKGSLWMHCNWTSFHSGVYREFSLHHITTKSLFYIEKKCCFSYPENWKQKFQKESIFLMNSVLNFITQVTVSGTWWYLERGGAGVNQKPSLENSESTSDLLQVEKLSYPRLGSSVIPASLPPKIFTESQQAWETITLPQWEIMS